MVQAPSQDAALAVVRYLLFDEIGAGGMATVHLGRQHGSAGFRRTVAIKRLYPQLVRDPELTAMLLDEARVAARIQHPNVVSTIDVVASGGELLLVMEYVHGESLARLLRAATRDGGAPPPRIACAVLAGALHGLHAAHEATGEDGAPLGLVHRDVSPHNLLVGEDGVTRVLDFGVAKAAGRAQVTRDGQIKGKLAYMPPEQIAGEPLDRRADVYAAGVVLWEMLTGERLFEGRGESLSILRLLQAGVDPPSSRRPGVPPALEAITLRALARDPEDRFPTAHAMALALEATGLAASTSEVSAWVTSLAGESLAERAARITEIEQVRATPVVTLPPGGDAAEEGPGSRPQQGAPSARRRLWAAAATTGGLLAIAAAAAGLALAGAATHARARAGVAAVARAHAAPQPDAEAASARGPSASAAGAGAPSTAVATASPTASPNTLAAPTAAPSAAMATAAPTAAPSTPAAPTAGADARRPPRRAPARDRCNPPFVIDAQGHKRYKRECF